METSDELKSALFRPFEQLDTLISAEYLELLDRHQTDFNVAKSELILSLESHQTLPMADTVKLELTLLDSLHTLSKLSFRRALLSNNFQSSPELDSLSIRLSRLITLRTVRIESNKEFLSDLEGIGLPPSSTERGVQRQELVWQIDQAIKLMSAAITTLEELYPFTADQMDLPIGVRLEDAISRLHHVASKLERTAILLQKVQEATPEPDPDSLRLVAIVLQDDLIRQRRNIELLRSVLSSQDEIMSGQSSFDLLSRTALLAEDLHHDLAGLNEALLAQFGSDLENYGIKFFLAIMLLIGSIGFIRIVIWLLNTISERSADRRLFYKRLIPVTRLIVLTVATYIVLVFIFGLDQRSLLAAGAAVGVAVGFAAQNVLKNIFGGMIIIFDQPFQVGDKIRIGETYGEVVSIGLRTTRIVTPDDNLVSVPNAHVTDTQVANANSGALHCQVVVELYVPGWFDTTKAKEIAHHAAVNSKYIYLEKPIMINIKDIFKETFLTQLSVKAYVLDTRHEFAFASDVTERAKAEFRKQSYFDQLIESNHPTKVP